VALVEPGIPTRQPPSKTSYIIDLGTRQWLVLHFEAGQLIESLLLDAFPSLEFTAHLRRQGTRITWSAVGTLPL
jgi:hypothetical protein